ncbi:uncharacterized protein LOC103712264 [Phoenix dactylifera]|uniref:Uncharacterized protein LOC103712264 n=1 Tax=Phoenix dactylifera TaxID=42345 RepID=A0A8B7CDX0_PHODC|nr:uncharacterized protein LOC103712264 [Phoenix dactylifera]
MDIPPGSSRMDARNGSDLAAAEVNSSSVAVPLLLNPAYARTKSIVHDELRNFRICLKWCALDHSSTGGRAASYAVFVALAVVLPAATSLSVRPPSSAAAFHFNQLVQLPESGLAAISFLTLAAFFRRHGLRQLLFLDGALRDDSAFVRRGYHRELDRAFRRLAAILLPSFSVELAHKILFFSSVSVSARLPFRGPVPWNSVAFVATLASWVYRTGVFLLVCVLFRLTCELQILRFEGLYKMFEDDEEERAGRRSGNAWAIFREHLRIKRQLLAISHRYRIFIIGCMVIISVSQLGALMLVLASKFQKNFCNSGDLLVCSAVQISGYFMCLMGAASITHRAQRAVSVASRWHAVMSCAPRRTSDASQLQKQTRALPINELHASDRDYECNLSKEPIMYSSSHQDTSSESRQALVTYLQHNGGGITLFGFPLDRGLLHTLFAFEMTLVLWILSKVVVLS